METIKGIKNNIVQILAITEKNLMLDLRFKFTLIFSFVTPIISILMPVIIMGQFFNNNIEFGPWTQSNFLVYTFTAYNIFLLNRLISLYPGQFRIEKFWKTLPSLLIAPFNRFNLLLGIFLSHIIKIAIPFTIFFSLCYIIYPISFSTVLFVIFIYFLMALVFSGMGLIIGIFAVSRETIWKILAFSMTFIFWMSCITYPYEIFPDILQTVINFNPLYYIFTVLRFAWVENDAILTLTTHFDSFLILLISMIIFPIVGVYSFNVIFKKYGIVGY